MLNYSQRKELFRHMSLIDLNKEDLLRAARFYDVDVKAYWGKAQITEALEEAGVTAEQWEADDDQSTPPQEEPEQEETLPANPEPEDEPEVEDDGMVLVKFIGSNRSYTIGKTTFTPKLKPFALLPREDFERLDRDKFREASAEEAVEFYGE